MNLSIEEAEMAPGYTGLLIDETPLLSHADVRPFIWAILLYRGAVKSHEIVGAITPICSHSELYSGWSDILDDDDDRTRLEWLVGEVLGDMTAKGLLRYNDLSDHWTLSAGRDKRHLPEIIKAVAGVDGSLPKHLLLDLEST